MSGTGSYLFGSGLLRRATEGGGDEAVRQRRRGRGGHAEREGKATTAGDS
jgi:hypothetical protein